MYYVTMRLQFELAYLRLHLDPQIHLLHIYDVAMDK